MRNRTNIYRGNQPQTSLSGGDGQTQKGSGGEYKISEHCQKIGTKHSQFGNLGRVFWRVHLKFGKSSRLCALFHVCSHRAHIEDVLVTR